MSCSCTLLFLPRFPPSPLVRALLPDNKAYCKVPRHRLSNGAEVLRPYLRVRKIPMIEGVLEVGDAGFEPAASSL